MTKPVPLESLRKLALAGGQAGLSFEDMLVLLRSGMEIEKVLAMLESGLNKAQEEPDIQSDQRRTNPA